MSIDHTVRSVTGRLSLREPQAESLRRLAAALEAVPALRDHRARSPQELAAMVDALKTQFPTLSDFERDFPSLCFALATGVGKTRLMGAFISTLHAAYGYRHFFVLAPNLTIYDKLIRDFTPHTPKYVFKGIAEFAATPPEVITGETYEQRGDLVSQALDAPVQINIFNISKINSEVRGGKSPRIKRLSEYLGQSYFDYLAGLPDLVLLMDESHCYRASAGIRALNELKPVLGLELTATPFTESGKGTVPFRNVVMDYPLARAIEDGFVKEPAVVTQQNFDPAAYSAEQLERIKLMDGVRVHEETKVHLLTYAQQKGEHPVKPFMLVIARDTTHAGELMRLIAGELFGGRYAGKVIQVDSGTTSGAEGDEIVQKLLAVESYDEPTEIVIHVNMLKEGWDVTNLYTIVPLRAANARTLIEQSIGRGLRLPYGRRTGVEVVDRLNIIAHDKFQEVVDEAGRGDSPIRLKQRAAGHFRCRRTTAGCVSRRWRCGDGDVRRRAEQDRADRTRRDRRTEPHAVAGAHQRIAGSADGVNRDRAARAAAGDAGAGGIAAERRSERRGHRQEDHGRGGRTQHRHPAHPGQAQGRRAGVVPAVYARHGEDELPAAGSATRGPRPAKRHGRAVRPVFDHRRSAAGGLHRPRTDRLRRRVVRRTRGADP